jgi:hypothetical protein
MIVVVITTICIPNLDIQKQIMVDCHCSMAFIVASCCCLCQLLLSHLHCPLLHGPCLPLLCCCLLCTLLFCVSNFVVVIAVIVLIVSVIVVTNIIVCAICHILIRHAGEGSCEECHDIELTMLWYGDSHHFII